MELPPQLSDSPSPFLFLPQPSTSEVSYETVTNLRDKLLGHSDSVDHLGYVQVYSASIYKCKFGAQHEFLTFHIRDKKEPRRQTVLLLDRVPRCEVVTSPDPAQQRSLHMTIEDVQRERPPEEPAQPPQKPLDFSSNSSLNRPFSEVCAALFTGNTIPAADMFFISTTDNLAGLCKWRTFTSYEELERMDFGDDDLMMEQVIAMACAVSNHCPLYSLFQHQCYWYAGVIWDITSRATKKTPVLLQSGKGRAVFARFISIVPHIAAADSAQVLYELYLLEWVKYRTRAEARRGNGKAAVVARAEVVETQLAETTAALGESKAEVARVRVALAEMEARLQAVDSQRK